MNNPLIVYPQIFPSYAPHGRTPLGFPLTIPNYEMELIARDLDAIYQIQIGCEMDHVIAFIKRDVVLEFFRKKFDRNFSPPKLKQKKGVRDYRKLRDGLVELWSAVYDYLVILYPKYIEMRPTKVLLGLNLEANSLILPIFFHREGNQQGGVTALIRIIQKQNAQLLGRERSDHQNPFLRDTFSWAVTETMIEHFTSIRDSERFYTNHLKRITDKRGKIASLLEEMPIEIFIKNPDTQKTEIPIRPGPKPAKKKKA